MIFQGASRTPGKPPRRKALRSWTRILRIWPSRTRHTVKVLALTRTAPIVYGWECVTMTAVVEKLPSLKRGYALQGGQVSDSDDINGVMKHTPVNTPIQIFFPPLPFIVPFTIACVICPWSPFHGRLTVVQPQRIDPDPVQQHCHTTPDDAGIRPAKRFCSENFRSAGIAPDPSISLAVSSDPSASAQADADLYPRTHLSGAGRRIADHHGESNLSGVPWPFVEGQGRSS